MVATLGLEFVSLTADQAVMRLPDQRDYHNHVGGPHAGAMFTLAESASGALVLMNFGEILDRALPLALSAQIRYLKLAMGDVVATATMTRAPAEVLAELDAGSRPEFAIDVVISTIDGTETGRMSVDWTLKPTRAR